MTTQEKLLAALFEKFAGESETAIAKRCGLSIARFSNYKLGKRDMDVDAVIGCAQVLGWDVRATVAAHEMETAPTARVKALWKAVASTAMALLVMVGASMPAPVKALQIQQLAKPESTSMYIMLKLAVTVRSWLGSCIRWWLAGLVDRHRSPKDTELAA